MRTCFGGLCRFGKSAVSPAWCRFTPKWWSKDRELYLHLLASLSRHRIGAITILTRIGRLGRSSETVSMPARSGCENIASATGAAGSIAGVRLSHGGWASLPRQLPAGAVREAARPMRQEAPDGSSSQKALNGSGISHGRQRSHPLSSTDPKGRW